MSTEENKAISRRFFAAFETNDLAALKEVLAPDLVAHHPGAPGPVNRQELLQMISMFGAAYSDQHYTIEDQFAEGDKVATRTTWRGIHSGDFQGLPPTGKQTVDSGISIDRIKDGKIVERWLNYN